MRFGIGYDIHGLVPGRRLVLGGVEIPYDKGLAGHSDADVLIHAIIDAVLGATVKGDIGQLFPDTDTKFKDISSMRLLTAVVLLLNEDGYKVANTDSVIIAQSPKMAPFIKQMRWNIANALQIEVDKVSVKAKTNEGFDAVGRGEAIAAYAIVAVEPVKS